MYNQHFRTHHYMTGNEDTMVNQGDLMFRIFGENGLGLPSAAAMLIADYIAGLPNLGLVGVQIGYMVLRWGKLKMPHVILAKRI